MTYTALIAIAAPPETVWEVLTDAPRWTEWNSTVQSLEGEIVEGGKIALVAKVAPDQTFKIQVAELDAPRSMLWKSGNFIFKGRRSYTLTATPEGGTQFEMTETFSGLFVGPISTSMPDLQPAFDQFAADLKAEAEAR